MTTPEWTSRLGDRGAKFRRAAELWFRWGLAVWIATLIAAFLTIPQMPLHSEVRNWAAVLFLAVALVIMTVVLTARSINRGRACREAAAYLHLPQKTGETQLPGIALRSPAVFDETMDRRGIRIGAASQ